MIRGRRKNRPRRWPKSRHEDGKNRRSERRSMPHLSMEFQSVFDRHRSKVKREQEASRDFNLWSQLLGLLDAMTEKQLINAVEDCVPESLYGFSKLHSNYQIDFSSKLVFDAKLCNKAKVALVSGGGSGHEPFPAGYVGSAMLTASVSGSVFASPPSSNILQAVRLVAEESAGVLLMVPNYTGDVLQFGLAAETATGEGILVDAVVVGEDVAPEVFGTSTKAGKRGTCGLVLVLKLAGYLAEMGKDLVTVKKFATDAVRSMGSMGLCLAACSKPGVGPLFRLDRDEMEVGVGVHGEAGVDRVKLLPARGAMKILLDYVIKSLEIKEEDEVVALVNNLGSLSYIELWLLAGELEKQLSAKNIRLSRLYAGSFFTSLNMAGVQICILKLGQESRQIVLEALDFPTTAPAWQYKLPCSDAYNLKSLTIKPAHKTRLEDSFRLASHEADLLRRCLEKISQYLVGRETHLNYLDSTCGDGDCGSTFARLAHLLEESVTLLDFSDPAQLFMDLSLMMEKSVGGTSGAVYSLFLKGISKELQSCKNFNGSSTLAKCWRAGVEGIKKYSTARLGDRTMLDSLETGCEAFEKHTEEKEGNGIEAFKFAVKAAEEGCRNTKFMKASAGRASYTNQSQQKEVDAGAYAVILWLTAVQKVIEE